MYLRSWIVRAPRWSFNVQRTSVGLGYFVWAKYHICDSILLILFFQSGKEMSNLNNLSIFESVTTVWDDYTTTVEDSDGSDDKWNHNFQTPISLPRIVTGLILILCSLLTMFSNALVLIAFFTRRYLRCYFNFYIIGITVADSVVGFFSMPMLCLQFLLGYWPIGRAMCMIYVYFDIVFLHTSILAVVVLSIDRYISLAKPLEHRKSQSLGQAMKCMFFAYAIPVTIWLAYVHWFMIFLRQLPEGNCIQSIVLPSWMSLSGTLIVYWIPFLLIITFNLKSFCVIRQSRRQIGAQFNETNEAEGVNQQDAARNLNAPWRRSEQELVVAGRRRRERRTLRALRTLSFLVVVLAICWTPSAMLTVVNTFCISCFPEGMYEVSTFIGQSNKYYCLLLYLFIDI